MITGYRPILWLGVGCVLAAAPLRGALPVITEPIGPSDFALISEGRKPPAIYLDGYARQGIRLAAGDLSADLGRAGGSRPPVSQEASALKGSLIIVGELGHSRVIDSLVESGRLDVRGVRGCPESWVVETVDQPVAGVSSALIIAGADMRGTIYGVYALSEAVGVSPWTQWSGVPIRHRTSLGVAAGAWKEGSPAVPLRMLGYDPARLSLDRALALVLRLRGNGLWPVSASGAPASLGKTADPAKIAERGLIAGCAFDPAFLHSPAARAEVVYGMGLPPHADAALVRSQEDELRVWANPNPSLILQATSPWGADAEQAGRIGAFPADIIRVWPDDGYGHLRLPLPAGKPRDAGILLHLEPPDLRGMSAGAGEIPAALLGEETARGWRSGARALWIAAAGPITGHESSLEIFFQLAWNPQRWPGGPAGAGSPCDCRAALAYQAARDFSADQAQAIAQLQTDSALLAAAGRPNGTAGPRPATAGELEAAGSFDADEAQARLEAWTLLLSRARNLEARVPAENRPAFRTRILDPIRTAGLLDERNLGLENWVRDVDERRACAPGVLDRARRADKALLQDGLRMPPLPVATGRTTATAARPLLGLRPEGAPACLSESTAEGWDEGRPADLPGPAGPHARAALSLPEFSALCPAPRTLDLFNAGGGVLHWTAQASAPWIVLGRTAGQGDERLMVVVDWSRVPPGDEARGSLRIDGAGGAATIDIRAWTPDRRTGAPGAVFAETGGSVSLAAFRASRMHRRGDYAWTPLSGLGARGSVMVARGPLPRRPPADGAERAFLEYPVWLRTPGAWTVRLRTIPAFPERAGPGAGPPLRYAVSFDRENPVTVDLPLYSGTDDTTWRTDVLRGAAETACVLHIPRPGLHLLRLWSIDPGVMADSILLENGPDRPRGRRWPEESLIQRTAPAPGGPDRS